MPPLYHSMTKIDSNPTKTGIILAVVTLGVIISTLALAPTAVESDGVSVEERGNNSVIIQNSGDTPVTATVNSSLHEFNVTVNASESHIVPVYNGTDSITIN